MRKLNWWPLGTWTLGLSVNITGLWVHLRLASHVKWLDLPEYGQLACLYIFEFSFARFCGLECYLLRLESVIYVWPWSRLVTAYAGHVTQFPRGSDVIPLYDVAVTSMVLQHECLKEKSGNLHEHIYKKVWQVVIFSLYFTVTACEFFLGNSCC
jgi:hypothetical protein